MSVFQTPCNGYLGGLYVLMILNFCVFEKTFGERAELIFCVTNFLRKNVKNKARIRIYEPKLLFFMVDIW